jgi:hypothetical protein
MANVGSVGNWVGEVTTTVGTGAVTLGGPIEGFTTFSSIGETIFWYAIVDGNNREAGLGTLSGNTFTRTNVYSTLTNNVYADNNPAPINLSGLAQIFSTFNKTAFDLLDDGVDASNAHLASPNNANVHISGPGAAEGDTVVWDDTAKNWAITNGFGEYVPAGDVLGQTLVWDGSEWKQNSQVFIDAIGNVGINNVNPSAELHVTGQTITDTLNTTGQAGIGTATPHASSMIDINGAIYTENSPLVNGAKRFEVAVSLPGTPDPNTIYFLTGP